VAAVWVRTMNAHSIKQAISPLRMIFWGGLLCIFDINFSQTTNGQGFKCDILDDSVGALLILVGVFKLSAIRVHNRYATVMSFIQVVSVLALINTIRAHFIFPLPSAVQLAIQVLGMATLAAIIAFCVAMRWLCEEAHLSNAARSWAFSTALFFIIYVIPLGGLYVVSAWANIAGKTFHIDLGPAGLLLLPIFAVPLIHLFVSTSRMKRAAEVALDVGSDEPAAIEPPPRIE
jgi:hypothetical protein